MRTLPRPNQTIQSRHFEYSVQANATLQLVIKVQTQRTCTTANVAMPMRVEYIIHEKIKQFKYYETIYGILRFGDSFKE